MKLSGASTLVRTLARNQELLHGSSVVGFRSGRKTGFVVFLIFKNGTDI